MQAHSFTLTLSLMRSSTMLISFSSPNDFSWSCTSSSGGSKAQRGKQAGKQWEKMTWAFGHASDSFFFPGQPLLAIALTWQPTLLSLRARILFTRRNIGPREILAFRKIFFRAANARERRKNTAPGLTPRYINASGRSSSLLCVWNRYARRSPLVPGDRCLFVSSLFFPRSLSLAPSPLFLSFFSTVYPFTVWRKGYKFEGLDKTDTAEASEAQRDA